jgi:hypothetical protein
MMPRLPSLRFVAVLALLFGVIASHQAAAQTNLPRGCQQAFQASPSAGTTALIGPGSVGSPTTPAQVNRNAGNSIQICGYVLNLGATSTAGFEYGTQTTTPCDTGTTAITPAWSLQGVVADNADYFRGLGAPAGTTLCVVTTGTVQLIIYYNNSPF